ncbi:hypothetical protein GKJPGBOP_01486 [Streptomyces paromomycinus]|uniref:DUF317 domain-containing protein n=1 Tax=Streptomyces paromomycinus TaxID=92743 RepID=A0A401VXP3_STREY|nr:hypothetical protein GKJPGBOP_01486 [Streptomyces paromomycinus]
MLPDPFDNLDPVQSVKVLPRHLAGPGPVDLRTAWPFPSDQGWRQHQAEEGTAYAVSPCLRLWTRFVSEPELRGQGTWTIGGNRAPFEPTTWQVTFDATTPVELLHAVHAELFDLFMEDLRSDQDRLFGDATAPQEGYAPLLARGWSHDVRTDGTQTFLAPERLGGVRHRYDTGGFDGPIWRAWGGYPSEPHWRARFSPGTPTTLVAAFTASLISTEPVHRTVKDIPFHTRDHLHVVTAAAPQRPVAQPPPSPRPGRTR